MSSMCSAIQRFLQSEEGPTAVEYAVMTAFILMVCILAVEAIGTNTNAIFEDARDALT
jgi:pilus assembly protein Flp/PilA